MLDETPSADHHYPVLFQLTDGAASRTVPFVPVDTVLFMKYCPARACICYVTPASTKHDQNAGRFVVRRSDGVEDYVLHWFDVVDEARHYVEWFCLMAAGQTRLGFHSWRFTNR